MYFMWKQFAHVKFVRLLIIFVKYLGKWQTIKKRERVSSKFITEK